MPLVQLLCPLFSCCASCSVVVPLVQLLCPLFSCCAPCSVVVPLVQLLCPLFSCCAPCSVVVPLVQLLCPLFSCCATCSVVVPLVQTPRCLLATANDKCQRQLQIVASHNRFYSLITCCLLDSQFRFQLQETHQQL